MFINVKIIAFFELAKNVEINFNSYVEVSLDCYECKALSRSIVISNDLKKLVNESFGYIPNKKVIGLAELVRDKQTAFCTPKCHLFPAYLKDIVVTNNNTPTSVEYLFEYSYSEFIDKKYNKQSAIAPSWARIGFTMVCPSCGKFTSRSSQNNVVRPFTCICSCGFVFYTETQEIPIIEIL